MKTKRKRVPPAVLDRGGLLTYSDHGRERCFGYLFEFQGHGIYEPTFGKLEVTSQQARTHNRLSSRAEIEGLDHHCALGMGGVFYTRQAQGQTIVTTWLGEEVSRQVHVQGSVLTFERKGMSFRGRLRKGEDCFGFKRVEAPATHGGKRP